MALRIASSMLVLTMMFLLAALPRPAAAEPAVGAITWLTADTGRDGRPNAGLADRILAYMRLHWPQVEHRLEVANAKRSWQLINGGEHVCHVAWLRLPEREKMAYFTATQMVPPIQLIVRADRGARLPLGPGGAVDLARLLADRGMRGVLIDGRSYGATIDRLITQRAINPEVATVSTGDFGSQLLPLLLADRADYTLEFDVMMRMIQDTQQRQRMARELRSLPIQGADSLLPVGAACPRNAWGLAAIQGIDRVLGTPAGSAMLREGFEQWTAPAILAHYRSQLDAFYKVRAQPSQIR
ncbi:TIGR02285 family protein [Pelomonas sp. KK5]|uniref:TIGR02285 family protein n=1 Tax=Pelomonas sp. KK5 TaxID=1855730 RepID=UPI00097C4DFE|nr:TIGR02285 family protein [Pelomonas sp. KK5]